MIYFAHTKNNPVTFFVIEPSETGWLLIQYNCKGAYISDTWHLTIEDAKNQALHESPLVSQWEDIDAESINIREKIACIHPRANGEKS
jgi:hypothetical protein